MSNCHQCGADLGVDRFCTNCGAPVAVLRTDAGDTAERPAVRPSTPPAHDSPPPPPPAIAEYAGRFPLYADQAGPDDRMASARHAGERPPRRPLPWILAMAAIVLMALVGGILLASSGEDDKGALVAGETDSETESGGMAGGEPTPGESPADPDSGGADPDDLAPHTRVSGPDPVRPGRDLAGNRVRYPATNMLDDDPETAYRVPGDSSGATITFTLPQETTIDGLGLVNGYAKMDTRGGRTVDWYAKNRRITSVDWVFDDGTTVSQELSEDNRDLQTVGVDDVTTTTIQLRIISVSEPGPPPQSRDVTAISDVLIHGTS